MTMETRRGSGSKWRVLALVAVGALALALAGTATANHLTVAGEPELFNLEHVWNFNPGDHEDRGAAGSTVGSDVEFFTHDVPLRDYATGALVDGNGDPLPAGAEPVFGERDFAVMGSYDRGGYIFDITDPENPEFVNVAPCRQPRNDVGIKKFADPVTGEDRVVLALTQQTGIPCPNWEGEGGGGGIRVNTGDKAGDLYEGVQWGATAPLANQTGDLKYAGTGCGPAQYAANSGGDPLAFQGKVAIVTMRTNPYDPADQCPTFTFFQKVQAAQQAGAIGLVSVDEDDVPRTGVTAVAGDIPAVEISNSNGMPLVAEVVEQGATVNVTFEAAPLVVETFGSPGGSGGIGLLDISDPYDPRIMYRIMTAEDGVHNFAFHPTAPFGYVSPGELPGVIQDMPIFDFTNLDAPVVIEGAAAPQTPGGIHDVELSISGDHIYAASENNYHIYDNTDPANPMPIGATPITPMVPATPTSGSYAHGLFPDSNQEIMVGQVESIVAGGFLAPGSCPGEGLQAYDISGTYLPGASKATPLALGAYTIPVIGDPAPRFCTSHFGRFVPDTRIFSVGWYIGGVRIVDFSDPLVPTEVATAVMADGNGTSNTWAAKIYEGPYVYAGDMERGFDVFRWAGEGPPPWEPPEEPEPADRDKVTGGGYLEPTDGKKINFGFNAKATAAGFQGHLTLNDKSEGVKVRLETVTSLTDVSGDCGEVEPGPDTAELTGTGELNGSPAGFRACVADRGEPGNSGAGGADLFYLECTAGCSYSTGDRTADDVIDGGNIQVHRAGEPAPQSAGATVLVLDPMLTTQSSAPVEVLTVTAYDAGGEPLAGAAVSLTSADAAGGLSTLDAVTDGAGLATFTVTVTAGDVEHVARSGDLSSNAVDITGNL